MPSTESWIDQAAGRLLRQRSDTDGWGYVREARPAVEPTAFAALALRCADASTNAHDREEALTHAARWVAGMQQGDGSVALSAALTEPRWATAHAILLWSNVDGFAAERTRATRWLERARGRSFRKSSDSPIGHDTSLVGWPWVESTHSWVEPTAMAIIALTRAGLGRSSRVDDGVRLLLDRAIPSGGWNYGNNLVFHTVLRPQPGPTGLVLLALACARSRHRSVGPALDYLESSLPSIRSAQSLGWGILGLSAWDRRPHQAGRWLQEAYAQASDDSPIELAHLILAAHERAMDCFGRAATKEASRP